MTSARQSQVNVTPTGIRRLGYLVGVGVSAGILFVVNNLLAWDIVPFLTDDFDQLLPIVNASLVASIVVNAIAALPYQAHKIGIKATFDLQQRRREAN